VTREPGKKTSEKVREPRRHRLPTAVQPGPIERAQARVGFKARFGAGPETREVSRAASASEPIRSQGAWCVDALPLNRVARSRSWLASPKRSGAEGRTDAAGGAATELSTSVLASDEGTQRSDRFREALPGVHAHVRHGEEGRHPRRGAPKCGAGVAVERAFALSSHGVVAGREARNHGVHRGRIVPKRATVKTPAPSTSPCRANGERTCPKGPCLGERRTPNRLDGARARLFASTRERRSRRDGPRSCFFGSA